MTSSWFAPASSAAGQQAQSALLLEVQGADRGGWDAAEAAAEIRDSGADRGFGQHTQAERQRRGADIVPALELESGGDRLQVGLAELAMRRPARRAQPARSAPAARSRSSTGWPGQRVANLGQEAEILAIAEHASRRAKPPSGLRDTHKQ